MCVFNSSSSAKAVPFDPFSRATGTRRPWGRCATVQVDLFSATLPPREQPLEDRQQANSIHVDSPARELTRICAAAVIFIKGVSPLRLLSVRGGNQYHRFARTGIKANGHVRARSPRFARMENCEIQSAGTGS